MLKISGNKISLTRGDTAEIDITLDDYSISADDTLVLTVKDSTDTEEILLQKTAISDNTVFKIEPSDTKELDYGDYVYDVQLTTSDGDVYTVIVPTKFKILEEVTW